MDITGPRLSIVDQPMMVVSFGAVENVNTVALDSRRLNGSKQHHFWLSKKNGNREEFNREKILKGVVRSAEKRPISMDAITDLVDRVENKVRSSGENEVTSRQIGEYVMEELVNLDEIAYIRFASVYRQFKDMSVFYKELKEVMEKDKKKNAAKQHPEEK